MSSSVFDVTSITVDDLPLVALTGGLENVTVSVVNPITTVTVSQTNTVSAVNVDVPGIQGPPGLQNVYVQHDNPAIQYGWGPEQTNYIWIQIP